MYKIMFVCHGNICRSPMAEFVFKDMAKKEGRESEFVVASSAISDEEIWGGVGNPVYPPVKALLRAKGISCEGKRAVQLKKGDGEKYDLFVCMDESNLRAAKTLLGARGAGKCKKLLSFIGSDEDVCDPWYTRDFNAAYADIFRGCKAMLEQL
jgi:protein-tyrosine phosphatase